MTRAADVKSQEARRKAQEQLAIIKQRDAEALIEVRKAQRAEYAKTEQLRSLRLAKEAADTADKEAAAKAILEAKSRVKQRKRPGAQPTIASEAAAK